MLVPMIVIASGCVLFGVYNALPLNTLIQPILGEARLEGHSFAGWPASVMLVVLTVVALAAAVFNHLYGVKKTGRGIGAVDHIHHAPILSKIYDMAEKGFFDPYDIGLKLVGLLARLAWYIDRGVDWIYDGFSVDMCDFFSGALRKAHTGNYSTYIVWALVALIAILILI